MSDLAPALQQVRLPSAQYGGRLVIFTSFYKQQGYAGYIRSLAITQMVLERMGIAYDYWPASGDFHVERALNKALTNFLASDYTDFLQIDSDESWDVEGLMRLITRPAEIVAGAYLMTNRWTRWTAVLKTEGGAPVGELVDGEPVLQAERVPAGFLRITKPPLLRFQEAYPDRWYWDTHDETGERMKVTQFFTTSLRDHEMFSQDFGFSEDLKAIGVKLWVEPNITIGHFGLTEHVGNLEASLRENKRQQSLTDAQVVEEFARAVKTKESVA